MVAGAFYTQVTAEGFAWVDSPDPAKDLDLVYLLRDHAGMPLARGWRPPLVEIVEWNRPTRRGRRFVRGELFGTFGLGSFCLSADAAAALGDILEPWGEMLPLKAGDATSLHLYRPFTRDCLLSKERRPEPELLRLRQGVLHWYHFDAERVCGADAFCIPSEWNQVFVSQRVVDAVRRHGLRGLAFDPAARPDGGAG